jgi:hypothetical protein
MRQETSVTEHLQRGWAAAFNAEPIASAREFTVELDAETDPGRLVLRVNGVEVVAPHVVETATAAQTILRLASVLPELMQERRPLRRMRLVFE